MTHNEHINEIINEVKKIDTLPQLKGFLTNFLSHIRTKLSKNSCGNEAFLTYTFMTSLYDVIEIICTAIDDVGRTTAATSTALKYFKETTEIGLELLKESELLEGKYNA